MGFAIRINGILPGAGYPKVEDFISLPVVNLVEGWLNRADVITRDASNLISKWVGQKGGELIQSDATKQPIYNASGFGSKPSVKGDGGDVLVSGVALPQSGYMVVGLHNTNPSTYGTYEALMGQEATNQGAAQERLWLGRKTEAGGSIYGVVFSSQAMSVTSGQDPTMRAYGSKDVVGIKYNAATGAWVLRVDKAAVKSGAANALTFSALGVGICGRNMTGTQNYLSKAPTAAGAIYSGDLTAAEMDAIDDAIARRLA